MTFRVVSLDYSDRFKRDFKALDRPLQEAVEDALKRLLQTPIPRTLRHHTLGSTRPKIHKIDVTSNHSHQITFVCEDGGLAVLLRIGTHKEIDRRPK